MPDRIDHLWILTSAALVMSMQIGFCMLEAGLVRSKNSVNVAIKNLIDFCVATVLFWAFGFAIMFGASPSGWFGTTEFFAGADLGTDTLMLLIFQVMFCATAATIVSGAVAERMSFASYIVVTIVISGVLYPIGGGWAWNPDGWLRDLGFRDFAGSTVVHSVGGWVALAAVIILGPRTGRFDSKTPLVSPHSLVFSTVGVIILFVGWIGFNGGSTLAFNDAVPLIIVNTVIAGAAGCLAALAAVWAKRGLPQLPATLNGCIGGLVAITANCDVVTTGEALAVGAVGGLLSYAAIAWFERLRIDDVVGAAAAHAIPGVWGTLAVGLFGDAAILGTGLDPLAQTGIQALGTLVFFVWAFGGGWLLLSLVNRVHPLRIHAEAEQIGLNVSEHGANTEITDLIRDMARHSESGEFTSRLRIDPYSEVGQIAAEYNRVVDKVIDDREFQENITRRLRIARDESQAANQKIFSSLQYARRIQQALLPTPAQLQDAVGDHFLIYQSRDLVSGDFYWCHRAADVSFCAVVDCTGHGVPGAFMSMIGHLLLEHIVVEKGVRDPAAILSEMHGRVRAILGQEGDDGATNRDGMEAAIVRFDPGAIVFAGAHRPLWWVRPGDGEALTGVIPGDPHGLGGGPLEPPTIEFANHTLPILPGLAIYLQSDGLVQQPNHLRQVFDHRRLTDLLTGLHAETLASQRRSLIDAFSEFRGGAAQRDDVTLLGIRFPDSNPTETPAAHVP